MTQLKKRLRKYFIMGSQDCTRNPVEILLEAVESGITAFQYREKGRGSLTGKAKIHLGQQLRKVCRENDVLFIVNDDRELVTLLDADGIHVGQDDQPVKELRKQFPSQVIGLSVSNKQELDQSPIELVDYVGAGPMFQTTTKEDAKMSVGVEWMRTLRDHLPLLPIVGIGGITTENAGSVLDAGADGVSVISAITKSRNIRETVRHL